jgi:hypothetical protein
MRNGFWAAALILLSGCSVFYYYEPPQNPWPTPGTPGHGQSAPAIPIRASDLTLGTDTAELNHLMQPCADHARETFPEAALRFEAGLPPETTLAVVARPSRVDGKLQHFFVEVDSIIGTQINGRILRDELQCGMNASGYCVVNNGAQVDGRSYAWGDNYSLATTDIVDWFIQYPDRPEEGNLLRKYLFLRQDGLVSGPCDPLHSEFQHFRLFRDQYSFVPPSGPQWRLRSYGWGARWALAPHSFDQHIHLISDMGMQEQGDSPHEVNTLSAERYFGVETRLLYETDQELVTAIKEVEKENLIRAYLGHVGTGRYTFMEHEVTVYTELEAKCTLSHRVLEDGKAPLSSSGEGGPMIRESMDLGCFHPSQSDLVVRLYYSHRYQAGYRDPEFVDKANRVFQSLAFSQVAGRSFKTQVANPPPVEIVRFAEEMLNQLGFDSGEADGIVRANTVSAVLDYQAAHGLPITGDIDEGLIKHLQGQIAGRTQPQSN